MYKTRKERIERIERIDSIATKRMTEQFKHSQMIYKRGTAVLSTTLLIGLLAFPSISVSATANDLANTSNKKLENIKEVTETINESFEEIETEKQEKQILSEDEMIENEQKINELKLLLSKTQINELNFEELTADEIDELFSEALASSNEKSIAAENLPQEDKLNLTLETIETFKVEEEKDATTYELNEEEDPNEEKEVLVESPEVAVVDEEVVVEEVTGEEATEEESIEEETTEEEAAAEKSATEKATAEKLAADKVAKKAAAEKAATEAASKKLAIEKATAEVAASKKATAEKEAANKKAATEKAAKEKASKKSAKEKAKLAKIYVVKSGDTLNKIANVHKISLTELKGWNNLSSNLIHPGDSLAVNNAGAQVVKQSNQVIDSNKGIEKMSNKEFVNFIGAYAAEVAPKNDLFASVMIAQAALESGYGGSSLSSSPNHNLFGIKGNYQGQTVTMYTNEYSEKGGWIHIPQNFKKYPSHAESLQDNANLLKRGTNWNHNFYAGAWVSNAKSYTDATAWLQGRYATDPSYASKLNRIIKDHNLTRFDKGNTGGHTTPAPTPEINKPDPSKPDSSTIVSSSYQVKNGDTLWGIATSKHVSVANLKSWNNLKSDTIYVGQKLVIKETVTATKPTPTPEINKPDSSKPDSSTIVSSSYQVKNGDTLWGIATNKHVSVANLKSWNNLKSDTIYVGQKLDIKQTITTQKPTQKPIQKPEINKPDASKPDSSTTETSSYQVKSGDTLWDIAASKHVSVANLKSWNDLKSDTIYVGQKLGIKQTVTAPTTKPEISKPDSSKPSSSTTETSSYQVKSGDTLWAIAKVHNLTIANLKTLNHLSSDVITIGQRLIVQSVSQSEPVKENTIKIYKVLSGDSLWSIAHKLNTSVTRLKETNHLKTDIIFVGQSILIK